ncbi:histidine phosphatase family protein [Nocardioides sp. GY 10113]|uniref:histidine phosphatase family protein n=1 Tax=Nocardioides sp. GY 10113 TaxID=2569761 RepID=UPI0010A81961|nr:phosphoglycerate mutase family protein [Nocardioides sp. GY 10113]TIC89155.1 histidine phosphatase family protein [Nocardioides sp. GY 10113]
MGILTLVRHGQASFGADDYDVLSATGREQARVLGRWLAAHGDRPETAVRGGLRRHRETWEGIAEGLEGPGTATVDPAWDEFDFLSVLAHYGEVTGDVLDHGADRRVFQSYFERGSAHWIAAAGDRAYPEPFADFVARSRRALAAAAAHPGPTVAVTSGGVIAALAAALLVPGTEDSTALGGLWERLNTVIVNTSVTRVLVGPSGARLLTFNEHPHLPRDLITYR